MRTRTAAILVFLVALALRFGYWAEIRDSPLDRWHEWDQTDMATYLEQARLIAEADVLAAHPYHPYHNWQERWPAEKWLAWYGPHAFHQAPAYAYLLALARTAIDAPLPWVKAVQLVLGAFTCVLALLVATRLAGRLAGIVAGLLAAFYGPLLYIEAQLLREGPALFCVLAILLLLLRHVGSSDASSRGTVLRCLGLGVLLGAFATFHEIGSVLLAVVLAAVTVHHLRRGGKQAGVAAGVLLAGCLVGFAPLLARNLAVGAPPFSVSCRTLINFVEANEAEARSGGATFSFPSPQVGPILDEANGSFLRAVRAVGRRYDGDVGRYLRNWSIRFAAIWQRTEGSDNTSYVFYRDMTPSLRFMLTFWILFPIGLAGAGMVFASPLRRAGRPGGAHEVWERNVSGHLVLLLYLVAVAGAFSFNHTVGRFRLYTVPFFWIYGGVFLALLVDSVRTRRPGAAGALLAAALAAAGLQQLASRHFSWPGVRYGDFATGCDLALRRGDYAFAVAAAEDALRYYPRQAIFFAAIARQHEKDGHVEQALELYRRALLVDPGFAPARQGLERSLLRARGQGPPSGPGP